MTMSPLALLGLRIRINPIDKTRSDILQGQAQFRGVKQMLTRVSGNHNFGKFKRKDKKVKNRKKRQNCHTFHLRPKKVSWWRVVGGVKSDFSVSLCPFS